MCCRHSLCRSWRNVRVRVRAETAVAGPTLCPSASLRGKYPFDITCATLMAGLVPQHVHWQPDGRVTKFRLRAKAIAQRYVASAYGLEKGCDPETVRQLLEKNTYIFPVNDKVYLDDNCWYHTHWLC
jgi:hypothetical protein